MPEVTYQILSYNDVENNVIIENDDYGIVGDSLMEARKNAFFANPFLSNKDMPMILLSKVDNVVCGKRMIFPTKIKVGTEIIDAVSGSNYYVKEEYRKYSLGASLMLFTAKKRYNFMISAGCSKDSLKIYNALKAKSILIPTYSCFLSKGKINREFTFHYCRSLLKRLLLSFYGRLGLLLVKLTTLSLKRKFQVQQLDEVPLWIENMVLSDTHKYQELHNKDWFTWNLNNNFSGNLDDKQYLYGVFYNKIPIGFFFTTKRERVGGTIGFLQEWQTDSSNAISEKELFSLAIDSFGHSVDQIRVSSFDHDTQSFLQIRGFIKSIPANIEFKDLSKLNSDCVDENLWRLRPGYGDYILG